MLVDPEGRQACTEQFAKLAKHSRWDRPVELDDILEEAEVYKGKIVPGIKHYEIASKRKWKVRACLHDGSHHCE